MIKTHTKFFLMAAFGIMAACSPLQNQIIPSGEGTSPVEQASETIIEQLEPEEGEIQALYLTQRSPDVPDLPFPDNPDPTACGIPQKWGQDTSAWLTGVYEGKLYQPIVFLYDSHSRLNIVAEAEHGSEVKIILFQENPVTDYYLVRIVGAEKPNEGWIPAPFLTFEPLPEGGS